MTKLFKSGGVVDLLTTKLPVAVATTNPVIVHSFSVGNIDGVNAATFDLFFNNGTTSVLLAKDVPVSGGGAFASNSVFNLEAGQSFEALASTINDLSFLSSVIERSNPPGKVFKNTGALPLTTISSPMLSAPATKPAVLYSLAVGNIAGTGGGSATFDLEFADASTATTKTFIKGVTVPEGAIFTFDEAITFEQNDQLNVRASVNSKLSFFGSYMEVDNVA